MNKDEQLIRKKSPVQIKNKKASFEYFFIETFTAGIVLTGTEIKSIRQGKVGLTDTYCMVINGEVWVKNMYIAEYSYGSYNNHVMKIFKGKAQFLVSGLDGASAAVLGASAIGWEIQ